MFGLFAKNDSTPAAPIHGGSLPLVNDYVKMIVAGMRAQSIAVDEINSRRLITRRIDGVVAGTVAIVDYDNGGGHFRFSATCSDASSNRSTFAVPNEIKEIEQFAQRAYKLKTFVNVRWRYAPDGVGNGNFIKDSLGGLSRDGGSLLFTRDLRAGTLFEIELELGGSKNQTRIGKLITMKPLDIEPGMFSKKSEKFRGEIEFVRDAAKDQAVLDFISARQADDRHRCFA
jgi:hypothetical protein